MRAVIAGAGPVACLTAVHLRARGFEVDVFERRSDVRRAAVRRGHSFNLTLTLRGLRRLPAPLRAETYRRGVRLDQRVVHHIDGSLTYQPYGVDESHHLLSIPRTELHLMLLDAADEAGARLHFEHDCLAADPDAGTLAVAAAGGLRTETADLLIGCDGANSVVRQEVFRHGGPMRISQDYLPHGFVEVNTPPGPDGGWSLLDALRDDAVAASARHGLHLWPRGEFLLLAQPNVDHSYTTTLFMPIEAAGTGPSFEDLCTPGSAADLFAEHFGDVVPHLPDLDERLRATRPATLRTLRCSRYHQGRTVLVGDAAHTMVPFFGQGINCSFEDVGTLMSILDERTPGAEGAPDAVRAAVAEFTELRRPAGDAITDLSLANLRELSARAGEREYHHRNALEKQLHRADPDRFMPLYDMVAFTEIPYHEVVERHERTRPIVDEIAHRNGVADGPDPLVLSADDARALLDEVVERLDGYHRDLDAGRLPASYLHGAHAHDRVPGEQLAQPEPPRTPTPLPRLLDEVFDAATRDGMVHPHPGFLAQVPSGGLFQSAVGDFVARALNRFVSVRAAAPGMVRLETNVIRWFATMLGYGPGSFGYLTTGGSVANLMGLRCALTALGDDEPRGLLYLGEQGHYSVRKAARLAGIAADRIRTVPVHPDLTLDVDALADAVAADRAAGGVPAVVVATAGTTNTGAVDDLTAVADRCAELGVRLHVDACFGGFFRLTGRGAGLLAGIERADSIAVDAHKSLFLPHGSSALLVRRRADLAAAFAVSDAGYIPELDPDRRTGDADGADDLVDLCDLGPELTRETRGLGAWLPLRLHGVDAFARCLDSRMDLADRLAAGLSGIDGIEVVPRGDTHLPVVAFRVDGAPGPDRDAATRDLCARICVTGRFYLATAELPAVTVDGVTATAGTVVRACVLHPRTETATVDAVVATVTELVARDPAPADIPNARTPRTEHCTPDRPTDRTHEVTR